MSVDMVATCDGKGILINLDASAAKGIASRKGVGKVRHLEVSQLWLQDKVASGEIWLKKIKTEDNLADALTKPVGQQLIVEHLLGTGQEVSCDRHELALKA